MVNINDYEKRSLHTILNRNCGSFVDSSKKFKSNIDFDTQSNISNRLQAKIDGSNDIVQKKIEEQRQKIK